MHVDQHANRGTEETQFDRTGKVNYRQRVQRAFSPFDGMDLRSMFKENQQCALASDTNFRSNNTLT